MKRSILLSGVLALCAIACGPVAEEEAPGQATQELVAPVPVPVVACKADDTGVCTSDTAGQPCKTSSGARGTCQTTIRGCGCIASVVAEPVPVPAPEPVSQLAAARPVPVPVVTCVTDSMGLCSAATGGQACNKADGTRGTCTSTATGCRCL
jgi:hypothetical protein